MGTSSHVEEASSMAERPPTMAMAIIELGGNGIGNAPTEKEETEPEVARRFSLMSKADELEQKVREVTDFYANKKVPNSCKRISSCSKDKIVVGRKEVVCAQRMLEVMRQFGTILKNLSKHTLAEPFLDPVDVEVLGLDDYYEETRQKEEEAVALATMQITQVATIGKLASDTHNELNTMNLHLEELRELLIRRCRKTSLDEKKNICSGITSLDPDYISKAMKIMDQSNPNHHADEVEIDIDAQDEITLWRLKFFVKDALEGKADLENQAKSSALKAKIKGTPESQAKNSVNKAKIQTPEVDLKRKRMIHEGHRGIYDAYERHKGIYDRLAQTVRKKKQNP